MRACVCVVADMCKRQRRDTENEETVICRERNMAAREIEREINTG